MSNDEFLPFTNEKGVKCIIWLTYGNKVSKSYRQKAVAVIQHLRRSDVVTKEELMNEIGLEYGNDNDDAKFNRILKPLRGKKDMNPLDIAVLTSHTSGGETYYTLSRDAFDRDINRVIASIRNVIDNQVEEEVVRLREENKKLRERVEQLESKLDSGGFDDESYQ